MNPMQENTTKKKPVSPLVYAAHAANDICWFVVPLVLPVLLDRFSIGYSGAGTILTTYLFVIAVFSFFIGRLSDKVPRIAIIVVGFFITFVGFLLTGLAPNRPLFMLFLVLTAFGVSSFHPVAYAFLDEAVKEKRGRSYGTFELIGAIAIMAMFLLNGTLLSVIGYQGVLIVTGIPSLIICILFLLNRSSFTVAQASAEPPELSPTHKGQTMAPALLILFIVSIIIRVISVTPVLNFIPVYLNREFGLKPQTAAYGSAFYFLGNLFGAGFSGRLSERFGPLRPLILFTAMIGPVIFLLGLSLPLWVTLLLLIALGITGGGCIPVQNLALGVLGSSIAKGGLFGFFMSITTIANAISPGIFGVASDAWGLNSTVKVFAFPAFISFAILLSLFLFTEIREREGI